MEEPQKIELVAGVVLYAFRLVTTGKLDPGELEPSFRSNRRKGKPARGRENSCPAIWDSISAYKSLQGAQDLYRLISERQREKGPIRIGEYAAELRLQGGDGLFYEDLGSPNGHVSIWGDPLDLAARVVDIHHADPDQQTIFNEMNQF